MPGQPHTAAITEMRNGFARGRSSGINGAGFGISFSVLRRTRATKPRAAAASRTLASAGFAISTSAFTTNDAWAAAFSATVVGGVSAALALARTTDLAATVHERHTENLFVDWHSRLTATATASASAHCPLAIARCGVHGFVALAPAPGRRPGASPVSWLRSGRLRRAASNVVRQDLHRAQGAAGDERQRAGACDGGVQHDGRAGRNGDDVDAARIGAGGPDRAAFGRAHMHDVAGPRHPLHIDHAARKRGGAAAPARGGPGASCGSCPQHPRSWSVGTSVRPRCRWSQATGPARSARRTAPQPQWAAWPIGGRLRRKISAGCAVLPNRLRPRRRNVRRAAHRPPG